MNICTSREQISEKPEIWIENINGVEMQGKIGNSYAHTYVKELKVYNKLANLALIASTASLAFICSILYGTILRIKNEEKQRG